MNSSAPPPGRKKSKLRKWIALLGPGLVTGAADDDPSGILTYSQSGAQFGLSQLWLAIFMLPLMISVQEISARIALVTDQGLASVIRQNYSRKVLYVIVGLLVVANTINLGADVGAMADAARLILKLPTFVYIFGFGGGSILLEVLIPYKRYAPILKVLSASLFAYILTGLIATHDWPTVLKATFAPHLQFDFQFVMIIVGVVGTTISPYCFFWQASQELEEKRAKKHGKGATEGVLADARTDTFVGMIFSEVTTWFILETTAVVFYAGGIRDINSSAQAAGALVPLVKSFPHAGRISEILFAVGVIGTGALAVPIFAATSAYAVAELFGWKESLALKPKKARGFYWIMILGTVIGILLNSLGVNPIKALIYAAVINGVIAVPIIYMLIRISNNQQIMGEHTSGLLSNICSSATFVFMALAAALMFYSFLVK